MEGPSNLWHAATRNKAFTPFCGANYNGARTTGDIGRVECVSCLRLLVVRPVVARPEIPFAQINEWLRPLGVQLGVSIGGCQDGDGVGPMFRMQRIAGSADDEQSERPWSAPHNGMARVTVIGLLDQGRDSRFDVAICTGDTAATLATSFAAAIRAACEAAR